MRQKRLLGHSCYSVLLLVIIFFGLRYQAALFSPSKQGLSILPFMQFKVSFPLLIGILLAVPHFINEFTRVGKWKVDWMKLIIIGLPFLYLSFVPLLYVFELVNVNLPFSSYAMGGYFGGGAANTFETLNGVIAGFIVSTSIVKGK